MFRCFTTVSNSQTGRPLTGLPVIVDAEGKETRWLQIPIPSEGYYPGQVSWAGNFYEVLVEKVNRFRVMWEFLIANVNNGTITRIFDESDPALIVASYRTNKGLVWVNDYSKILVLSVKDGWRHAYVCSRDGKNRKNITPGEFDIIELGAVDESGGLFYFNASPGNGTQSYLFRVLI